MLNQSQPPASAFPLPNPPVKESWDGTHRPGNHDQLTNQCSTNELATHRTLAGERDMDQPSHPVDDPAGRCSLERR
ncbi:hypothetical protein Mame01_70970 [Microbispora amethystogenes]|nr:hypothetical protein Mame01_70970 [Microbispora amethystogenes]